MQFVILQMLQFAFILKCGWRFVISIDEINELLSQEIEWIDC